jgi:hypothetical protein
MSGLLITGWWNAISGRGIGRSMSILDVHWSIIIASFYTEDRVGLAVKPIYELTESAMGVHSFQWRSWHGPGRREMDSERAKHIDG